MQETIKKLDGGWLKPEPITEAMVRCVVGTTLQSLGNKYDLRCHNFNVRESSIRNIVRPVTHISRHAE